MKKIIFIISTVAFAFPIFAQAPPPSAAPIDGLSGALVISLVGAGLAVKKYLKKD